MTGTQHLVGPVSYGVAGRPKRGYERSGDQAVALACGGDALLAVIDGLGHGPDAAAAARVAADALHAHPDEPVDALLQRCHQALRRTRGAVISLAKVTPAGVLQWAAVGNVQGVLVRTAPGGSTRLVARGGVVGLRLPRMRPTNVALGPGDLLVLFTDGVADAPTGDALPWADDPQRNAQHLLDRRATDADDALVLVASYVGASW